MEEQLLPNNRLRPIAKVSDKIHRPTEFWQPAVHDLLEYLESIGYPYSPRVFENDSEGREVLSYIKGESGAAGWTQITDDEGLIKYAKFLRAYHDAVSGYRPSADLEWANGSRGLQPGQIICHGDFGPWNIVWKDGNPVGIIDWDLAHPNRPEHDIYSMRLSIQHLFVTMKPQSAGIISKRRRIENTVSRYFLMHTEFLPSIM